MHKSFKLFFIALLSGSCFLQAASTPKRIAYSNIASNVSTPPAAPEVQPYELTLDALVNTSWGAVDNVITLFGTENRHNVGGSLFHEQQLQPLSITLEKNQDLVIYAPHASVTLVDHNMSGGAIYFGGLYVVDWNGWDNFFQGWRPLDFASPFMHTSGLEGTTVDYYFKNQHAGKISLQFIYCISGDDNNGSSRFNVEDVIVTIKSGS